MITVFTPTFNRAYIITKLYESLKNQTNYNFEWIVVDDGSTDNTSDLFSNWLNDNNEFRIKYYRKQNGGKHRATNFALRKASGEIFVIVDSDDILTNDAIEKIIKWFEQIKDKKSYCGITANKGYINGLLANPEFKEQFLDMSYIDALSYEEDGVNVLSGERLMCIYTHILKEFCYPEFDNEMFVTEAVAFNRIANAGYKTRFFNDVIYLYEYKEDGLTKSGSSLFINNPHGYGLWLKEKDIFMNKSFSDKLKTYYSFTCELQDKYEDKLIAECIDIPVILVKSLKLIHKLISIIRK